MVVMPFTATVVMAGFAPAQVGADAVAGAVASSTSSAVRTRVIRWGSSPNRIASIVYPRGSDLIGLSDKQARATRRARELGAPLTCANAPSCARTAQLADDRTLCP